MPSATIDGLRVNYLVQGRGPHLLVLSPGGFNSTIERWQGSGVWKEMDALNTLSKSFTVIAYDRREAGLSGGARGKTDVAAVCEARARHS